MAAKYYQYLNLLCMPILKRVIDQVYQTAEGCLSLSGTRPTKRYKQITVKFRNQSWQTQTLELTDFAAEIVQHEIDHCNGIII